MTTTYQGPSAAASLPQNNFAGGILYTDLPQAGITVEVNPNNLLATSDDLFRFDYVANGISSTASGSVTSVADPFGQILYGFTGNHRVWRVFKLASTLSGSLDHVSLVHIFSDGSKAAPPPDPELHAYIAFGQQTQAAAMPSTGSVTFGGSGRGTLRNSTVQLAPFQSPAFDISMTVNYATGQVTGQTSNFMQSNDQTGAITTNPSANFSISGTITGSNFTGTLQSLPGGAGLTGQMRGAFFGPTGGPPAEAGISYSFGAPASGNWSIGGAVLGRP